ncbi:MAG: PAS domain S-box protein [Steroidobacteraceae bacterium]
MAEADEDKQLRITALRNIETIQLARRQAERELLEAKQVLQSRTEELEQQREWFEVTLASIGDAVITTDMEGRLTFINSMAESMTGWSSEDARGQVLARVCRLIDQDTRQPVDDPIARVLLTGTVVEIAGNTSLLRKDGSEIVIEDSAAPIRDHRGKLAGVVLVFRDVTQRRRDERALRRSEQLLSDFFENAAVGLHWVGPDGIVIRVNQTELDLLGYTREEYVGRHIAEFHADSHVIDDILDKLSRGQTLEGYQAQLRCKDGSIKHVLISSNVLWEDGNFIHTRCFTRDISAQKIAELALREEITTRQNAEAMLRETDRRKDEFLATLAHELRNPLAPIRQAALISTAPQATDAQRRWSHEVINRQVQHMSLLLDDLLDISRVTRGVLELRPKMAELASVVEAAVETARPLIEAKQHRLTIDVPPTSVMFAGDPLRLAQVLSNLLTNAAKYTDPAGEIRLAAIVATDQITITVTDTGIGLPQHALTDIFLMFSQVQSSHDRTEGGLGIGLALAKGLVQLHGGEIEARSAGLGRGSEFIVRLPLRTTGASEQLTARPVAENLPAKRRVLIADDNRDAAESLAILLELDGHNVTVVDNGRAALATCVALLPEVVILDIGMPELNGYEVARRVRQLCRGDAVTLIAVTGWGQESDKAMALAAGFNHHFTKPIEPEQVITLLGSAAQRA